MVIVTELSPGTICTREAWPSALTMLLDRTGTRKNACLFELCWSDPVLELGMLRKTSFSGSSSHAFRT